MPIFIDHHLVDEIDRAARQRIQTEAILGIRDPTGTLPLGHWAEDGTIYCVIDAPDKDAVCRHHHARGLSCDDLHELDELDGSLPLSGADRAAIVAAIARLWHSRPPGSRRRRRARAKAPRVSRTT